jgi:hypothetical protein
MAMLRDLERNGFTVFKIDEAKERLERFSKEEAERLCRSTRHNNILAARGAKLEKLREIMASKPDAERVEVYANLDAQS